MRKINEWREYKSTYTLEDADEFLLRLFPELNKKTKKNTDIVKLEESSVITDTRGVGFYLMDVRLTGALSRLGI